LSQLTESQTEFDAGGTDTGGTDTGGTDTGGVGTGGTDTGGTGTGGVGTGGVKTETCDVPLSSAVAYTALLWLNDTDVYRWDALPVKWATPMMVPWLLLVHSTSPSEHRLYHRYNLYSSEALDRNRHFIIRLLDWHLSKKLSENHCFWDLLNKGIGDDAVCERCNMPGDLVCCDTCCLSFHQRCEPSLSSTYDTKHKRNKKRPRQQQQKIQQRQQHGNHQRQQQEYKLQRKLKTMHQHDPKLQHHDPKLQHHVNTTSGRRQKRRSSRLNRITSQFDDDEDEDPSSAAKCANCLSNSPPRWIELTRQERFHSSLRASTDRFYRCVASTHTTKTMNAFASEFGFIWE